MGKYLKSIAIGLLMAMWVAMSAAEEITPDQIRILDQQVQDIKEDVLEISTKLIQLEEKLVYPPNSRFSIFLTLEQPEKFRLDAVKIKIDGKMAIHQIYSAKELDALQNGGAHRVYTGNIRNGEHWIEVSLVVKSTSYSDYLQHANYVFTKGAGAKVIEISIAKPESGDQRISFRD